MQEPAAGSFQIGKNDRRGRSRRALRSLLREEHWNGFAEKLLLVTMESDLPAELSKFRSAELLRKC